MKQLTDKQLADFLLETRQHGPQTFWRYIKKGRWRWAPLIGFFAVLFALGTVAQTWWFSGFAVGWAFGMFTGIRDELRRQRASWRFYDKVTDWQKVEVIAHGKPLA